MIDVIMPISMAITTIFFMFQMNIYRVAGLSPIWDIAFSLGLPVLFANSNAMMLSTLTAGITFTLVRLFWRYNYGYWAGNQVYRPTKYDN